MKIFCVKTYYETKSFNCVHGSVGWGCRIHRLHLYKGVRLPPKTVMDMTLNNLIVVLQ